MNPKGKHLLCCTAKALSLKFRVPNIFHIIVSGNSHCSNNSQDESNDGLWWCLSVFPRRYFLTTWSILLNTYKNLYFCKWRRSQSWRKCVILTLQCCCVCIAKYYFFLYIASSGETSSTAVNKVDVEFEHFMDLATNHVSYMIVINSVACIMHQMCVRTICLCHTTLCDDDLMAASCVFMDVYASLFFLLALTIQKLRTKYLFS